MKPSRALYFLSITLCMGGLFAPVAAETHLEPPFPDALDAVAGPSVRVENASESHDFTIRFLRPCLALENTLECEGPGRILVSRKREAAVLQVIDLPNLLVLLDREKSLPTGTAPAMQPKYVAGLVLDDFNFDGYKDLAVMNGRNAEYGGVSYDIYLFDPSKKRFFHSRAMSDLASRNTLFEVDPDRRLLTSSFKSGCCYHMRERYRVVKNVPVPAERHVEELTVENKMKITDEKWIGGQWRRKVRPEASDAMEDMPEERPAGIPPAPGRAVDVPPRHVQ